MINYDQSEPPQYETRSGDILNYPPLPQANAYLKEGERRKPNILVILLDDASFDLTNETWELYNIDRDFSQAINLAEVPQYQDKLNYLKNLFWAEAGRYNVLPLDDRKDVRGNPSFRPGYFGRTHFEFYPGAIRLLDGDAPSARNRSFSITVGVDLTAFENADDIDGVFVSHGGQAAGYSLYVQEGLLKYSYNWFNRERYTITAAEPITPGSLYQIQFNFTYDGDCAGDGGTGEFLVIQPTTKDSRRVVSAGGADG